MVNAADSFLIYLFLLNYTGHGTEYKITTFLQVRVCVFTCTPASQVVLINCRLYHLTRGKTECF